MQAYLKANPKDEWINIDMAVSKQGKGYAKLDAGQKIEPQRSKVIKTTSAVMLLSGLI